MDKPWLRSYPEGLAAEIDPDRYGSIVELLEESFRSFADRPFAVCMDRAMTYRQLDERSRAFGAWLQSRGLAPGARVAVMLPNVLQFPVAAVGIIRAGYVMVTVNPLYTPRELEHQLRDSGAEAIVVLENFASTLQQVLPRTRVRHVAVTAMGDLLGFPKGAIVNYVVRRVKKMVPPFDLPDAVPFRRAMAEGARAGFRPAAPKGSDTALLQYTGGTTGVSKGAVLTHRNIVAAMMQFGAGWQVTQKLAPRQVEQYNVITALPLYHIYALVLCMLLSMREGHMLTLIPNPRDLPSFVRELAKRPFHVLPGLNTLFIGLMANEAFRKLDFSNLLLTGAGGMATMPAVAEQWQHLTGCVVAEGWGLSETTSAATVQPPGITAFNGTIGLPLPSVDLRVRDEDDRDVPVGQPGELCIKGPNVMPGYYNRPDETAKVMTRDGYFRTGDIGVMDERGFFRIVDRKKDMILVSGFNVFPSEIEAVVSGHPGVLECAAIGVADPESGEAVKLFVVRRDPALTEQALRDWCKEQFTGYKRPRHIEFRKDLPKTPVGKVLRRELRS
jgi:long-chain acyl-CoA synthetase